MAQKSGIPYTDSTCNGTAGCSHEPCSPGCLQCWALPMTHRMAHSPALGDRYKGLTTKGPDGRLRWTGEVRVFPDVIEKPLHWKKGRPIFWCSMSDIAMAPADALDRMFAVMALTPQHTHLVVTKRIQELRDHLTGAGLYDRLLQHADRIRADRPTLMSVPVSNIAMFPYPNVWILLTACTQRELDEKGPVLLDTPAAHRGLSIEPALSLVHIPDEMLRPRCIRCGEPYMDADGDWAWPGGELRPFHRCYGPDHEGTAPTTAEARPPVDVVILGCESGPGARWPAGWNNIVRATRDQCAAAGVGFGYKQGPMWGSKSGRVITDHRIDLQEHWDLPWRVQK